MGVRIARAKTLPIGVDLGSTVAKAAQLRADDQDAELLAATAVPLPRSLRADLPGRLEFLSGEMRKRIKSGGFKGRQAILSVPARETFVHHVRIPKVPPAEIEKTVQAELAGKLPYPVEQAVIRYVVAGEIYAEGDTQQEVITISAHRETLDAYLGMARRAKLDVIGINVESCAVVECFSRLFRRKTDAGRTILYIDLGSLSTQVVLSHGARIVFARNLSLGGERFDQAVADAMGIPIEEANELRRRFQADPKEPRERDELHGLVEGPVSQLIDELTQCLRYYESVFRNQAIERAIFVGGQAHDKPLCQEIARRLDLPAQIGDPLMRVRRPDGAGLTAGLDLRTPQPDWAVAVGLSLGAGRAA